MGLRILQCRIAEFGMLHRLLPAYSVEEASGGGSGAVAAATTTKRENPDVTPVRRCEGRSATVQDGCGDAPPCRPTPQKAAHGPLLKATGRSDRAVRGLLLLILRS